MRKIKEKFLAVVLLVIMLLNQLMVLSKAIETYTVDLELQSNASNYVVGDTVTVNVVIKDYKGYNGIAGLYFHNEYNTSEWEFLGVELPMDDWEITINGIGTNDYINVQKKSNGTSMVKVGGIICQLHYKAKTNSVDKTSTITAAETNASDGVNDTFYDEGTINEPSITLPVKSEAKTHTIHFTNTDRDTGSAITTGGTIYKVTFPDGTNRLIETDSAGKVDLSNLAMPSGTLSNPYTYTIQEVVASTGYIKNENPINLSVNFANDGTIISANLIGENGTATLNENEIKVTISNKKQEAEAEKFTIVVNKKDKDTNAIITASSTTFKITDANANAQYIETTNTGKIQVQYSIPETAGTYTYKIQEVVAPNGYDLSTTVANLNLTFGLQNGKMVLTNATVVGADVTKDSVQNNIATFSFLNTVTPIEKKKVTMSIQKKNSTGDSLINSDTAVFKVTDADNNSQLVETNAGIANIKFDMPETAGVYIYKIQEMKAPNGYELDTSEKQVKLTFALQNGNMGITNVTVTGDNIIKISDTTEQVNLSILNEKTPIIVEPDTFSIVVNKKDKDTNDFITASKATFKITAPDASSQYMETDEQGKLEFKYNVPETAGTYEYQLQEVQAPIGFDLNTNMAKLSLKFETVSGKIVLKDMTFVGNDYQKVNLTDNILTIDAFNTKTEVEPEKFTFSINKVDLETNTNITADTAIFKVISPSNEEKILETDASGKIEIQYNKPDTAGTHTYKIKEIKAPNGYNFNTEEMLVRLNFGEKDGKMIIKQIQLGGSYIGLKDFSEDSIDILIKNEKKQAVVNPEQFTLKINKIDQDNMQNITNNKAIFKLTNAKGESQFIETDQAGLMQLKYNIPETAGTEIYKLQEIVAPQGYQLNSEEISIKLTFTNVNETITLTNAEIVGSNANRVSLQNNVLMMNVTNIKTITEQYQINLNKKDLATGENIVSGKAIFSVTDANSNVTLLQTDESGRIQIKDRMPEVAGIYTYKIQEVTAPNGYLLDDSVIELRLTFAKVDGKMILQQAEVIGSHATKTSLANNVLTVAIANEKENTTPDEPKQFSFVINKKDKQTNENITIDTAIFKLKASDGTTQFLETDATGKVKMSFNMPKMATTMVYALEEIKAPDGYILNIEGAELKLIFAQEDGQIVLQDASITGSQVLKESLVNQILTISVLNEKTPVVVIPQKYTMTIHVKDIETGIDGENIVIDTAVFKVTDAKGNVQYVESNAQGNIVLEYDAPEQLENQLFSIQQVKAPSGYEINPNQAFINVTFEEKEGEILVKDAVITGTDIAKNEISDKDVAFSIFNKKKEEKQKFEIQMNKKDLETGDLIVHDTAIFKIANGSGKSELLETDENGMIQLAYDMPEIAGTYTYTVKEMKAPSGYRLDSTLIEVKLTFEKVNNIMTLTNAQVVGATKDSLVDNLLTISIGNIKTSSEEPIQLFTVDINKKDTNTGEVITADTAIFKLVSPDKTSKVIETDLTGNVKVVVDMPTTAGTYTYELQEIKAPNGYVLNGIVIPIYLTFEEQQGEIVLTDAQMVNNHVVKENILNNVLLLTVFNEPEEKVTEPFTINMTKKDQDTDEIIKASSAIFKITNSKGETQLIETDENGKIKMTYATPEVAGTYIYKLQEIKAPNGYVLVNQEMEVKLIFEEQNGIIVLTDTELSGSNISIDEILDKELSISIFNKKEEVIPEPSDEFSIAITKKEEDTKKVITKNKAIFKLKTPSEELKTIETNDEGMIQLVYNIPETEGKYIYEIQETKAPTGYILNDEKIKIELTFENIEGKIKLVNTNIVGKNATMDSLENNILKMSIMNQKEQQKEENNFDVKVNKSLTEIVEKYSNTGTEKVTKVDKAENAKIEVKATNLAYLDLKLTYKLVVTNTGTQEGTVANIVDKLPSQLSMNLTENKGWTLDAKNGIATYDLKNTVLKPGESRQVTIILRYSGKQNKTGSILNYATFEAVDEKDGTNTDNTNNLDKANFIISIMTGQEVVIYTTLSFSILALLGLGIFGIKRYVL